MPRAGWRRVAFLRQKMPTTTSNCLRQPKGKARNRCRASAARVLQEEWLERLAFGPSREADRLVQIWLGVFPVRWNQLPPDGSRMLASQIQAIRDHLDGTYGDLLGAMLTNPAVQISLNGPANRRQNPNENLARELLELFSLGEGNYREADVIAVARVLTGYRLNRERELVVVPRRHHQGAVTILGRTPLQHRRPGRLVV